jgi:heat shock protein HslJ
VNVIIRSIRRHRSSRAIRSSGLIAVIVLAVALAVAGCQGAESLAGPTWQWTAEQETNSAGQPVIADPTAYTIEFLTNGTVNVRADCNMLTGTYSVGVPLDLTIAVATPTNTACGETSHDRVYLEYLSRVSSYSTHNGELKLFFADEVGGMTFTNGGS